MGRITIKGLNYTEIWFSNKKKPRKQTIHFNMIAKERKSKDCGVWIDGKRELDYDGMVDHGFFGKRTAKERLTDLRTAEKVR